MSSMHESSLKDRKHLNSVLSQLHNIEEQFELADTRPTASLLNNVQQLIYRFFEVVDLPLDILATPEGKVIVSCSSQLDNMLYLECAPEGNVYCMIKIDGKRTRQSYPDISKIPDSHIAKSAKYMVSSQE